jgi:hypothetical protein
MVFLTSHSTFHKSFSNALLIGKLFLYLLWEQEFVPNRNWWSGGCWHFRCEFHPRRTWMYWDHLQTCAILQTRNKFQGPNVLPLAPILNTEELETYKVPERSLLGCSHGGTNDEYRVVWRFGEHITSIFRVIGLHSCVTVESLIINFQ